MPPMQTRTAQLGIAAFWAGIACVLGALAASLAFAFLTTAWSSRWPPSFEIPYVVFASGFLAAAVGYLPLIAVLWIYLSVARRWRSLERN